MQRHTNITLRCVLMISTVGALAVASATSRHVLHRRVNCNEGDALVCYGVNNTGTPQNLDPDDVAYAASYFRLIATDNAGTSAAFWTMPVDPGPSCDEWTLPLQGGGTVLALAKHTEPLFNSSVLYADIATTIDGGLDATAAEVADSISACGANGGQMPVKVNSSDPAYSASDYTAAGNAPQGITIKLVAAPASSD